MVPTIVAQSNQNTRFIFESGAIIRGDTTIKDLALVFTGDEFGDGADFISAVLSEKKIKASFFLTGNFYRNPDFKNVLKKLKKNGNYLGSHSDKHLLYCDWENRDSLLVTRKEFTDDLLNSYIAMKPFGINKEDALYYMPPYEWYNDTIAAWTAGLGLHLINFSPGTRSNADYTYPEMEKRYIGSDDIYSYIIKYEKEKYSGLNGFILLVHIGTDARRTDKFYHKLPALISELKSKGYRFVRIDKLLEK